MDAEISGRLARIETNQETQGALLERLVNLFDRVLTIEQQNINHSNEMSALREMVAANQAELNNWRTMRVLLMWLAGFMTTVAAGVSVKLILSTMGA